MSSLKTHKKCKYFSFKKCPYLNTAIMKKATQDVPEHHGGNYQAMQSFPADKEIDVICAKCDMFTQK